MKRVLVTGGAGFIGSNLVRVLLQRNYEVRIFDNGLQPVIGVGELPVEFLTGDVRDAEAIGDATRGADVVVHLAAAGSVVESVADPEANFEINVYGTFNVLRACVEAGVGKVVFASTGGALIGNALPPVDERSLPKPISPYGASKLCGEAYCHAFSHSYGLGTVALRFANVYGPSSHRKAGAITTFIRALRTGQPIKIFGDGFTSRDYLYVDDLCRGISLAIDADLGLGQVFHLASGVETSVNQLASVLKEVAGKPHHPVEHHPARAGEVERNFASFELAKEHLGFVPEISLREGLKLTWEWFLEQEAIKAAA